MGEVIKKYNWWLALIVPLFVTASFFVAQVVLGLGIVVLSKLGVDFQSVDENVFATVGSVAVYILSFALVIGIPLFWGHKTTTSELGVFPLLRWRDAGLAMLGFIVYFVLAGVVMVIVQQILPGVDIEQEQSIGFEGMSSKIDYFLAFVTLVMVAPVAEEFLFRGYLFGKLKDKLPLWLTVIVVSVVFAALHLPGDGAQLQWNVAFNVFALSIVLCLLRIKTNSVWAGILLHMAKNGLAFYVLFLTPFSL